MPTREQIESVAKRSIDAWNRHDVAAVGALYAASARFRDSGMPEHAKLGRDRIAEYSAQFMATFADLELEQLSLTVDGDRAVQEWRASGTHTGELGGMPASGRTVAVLGCAVWHFGDDGLIIDEIQYLDRLGLLASLGALDGTPLAARRRGDRAVKCVPGYAGSPVLVPARSPSRRRRIAAVPGVKAERADAELARVPGRSGKMVPVINSSRCARLCGRRDQLEQVGGDGLRRVAGKPVAGPGQLSKYAARDARARGADGGRRHDVVLAGRAGLPGSRFG